MKIAPDKWKHFYVGLAMGLLFELAALWLLPLHPVVGSLISLLAIAVIGYGFELFSKFTGRGHYEVMDAVAVVLGGLPGMACILAIHFLL